MGNFLSYTPSRQKKVTLSNERVLILGASSGIGRRTANHYAKRDAHVLVVGRREKELELVKNECAELGDPSKISKFMGDFTNAKDMVELRELIEKGE